MKHGHRMGLAAVGAVLLIAAAVACGSEPADTAPAGQPTVGAQPTVFPEVDTGAVTGTVTYRERIALGPDASVLVKLLDVSRADAPSVTLSEQVIDDPGQVPVEFELSYKTADIDDRFTYVVRAEIFEGGELVFTTTTSYPVITRGSSNEVDLILERVPGENSGGEISTESALVCASTAVTPSPIEFFQAGDTISTAFDGVNAVSCTFPEEIESVSVLITNTQTGATHRQVFSLEDPSRVVKFPLDNDVLSTGTLEALVSGEYQRMLQAVAVDGDVYDLTANQGALVEVSVLPLEVAPPEVLCMSTLAVRLPIEIAGPGDVTSTAFDGINVANCIFPEEIKSVTVRITNIETGATHTQVFSLPEATDHVSFPLGEDALSIGTLEVLEPGEYWRVLQAVAVDGDVYDLTAGQGALDTITILPVIADETTTADVVCASTRAAQLPIEFVQAGDVISTAFDGINVANCTFPEEIESVTVVITNVETGATHTQVFSLPEATDQVSFPLGVDALSFGTLEVVEPGEYERVLQAVAVAGDVYDLTAGQGALDTVTVLPESA